MNVSSVTHKTITEDKRIIAMLKNEVIVAQEERDGWELKYDTLLSQYDRIRKVVQSALEKQCAVNQRIVEGIENDSIHVDNTFIALFNRALDLNTQVADTISVEEERAKLKSSKTDFPVLPESVGLTKKSIQTEVTKLEQSQKLLEELLTPINLSDTSYKKTLLEIEEPKEKLKAYVTQLKGFIDQYESHRIPGEHIGSIAQYNLSLESDLMGQIPDQITFDPSALAIKLGTDAKEHLSSYQSYIDRLKTTHDLYNTLLIKIDTLKAEIYWEIQYKRYTTDLFPKVDEMHQKMNILEGKRKSLLDILGKSKQLSELESTSSKKEAETLRVEFQMLKKSLEELQPSINQKVAEFSELASKYDEKNNLQVVFEGISFFNRETETSLRENLQNLSTKIHDRVVFEHKKLVHLLKSFEDQILGKDSQKGQLHYQLNYLVSSIFYGSLKIESVYARGEPGKWKLGLKNANRDYMGSVDSLTE